MKRSANKANHARARAHIYLFLSRIYSAAPTEPFWSRWRGGEFLPAIRDLLGSNALSNALPSALNGESGPLAQEALEDLVLEYNSLFMAPGPRYVPPYESVYTDVIEIEHGPFLGGDAQELVREASALLWGEPTVAVQRAYAAAGLEVASVGEPPDHLGLELEFMALLCQREAEAWQAKAVERARKQLETERDFLEAHLLRWLPFFRAKLEANATRPFYRVMAGLTQRILEVDRGHVEAALEKPTRR